MQTGKKAELPGAGASRIPICAASELPSLLCPQQCTCSSWSPRPSLQQISSHPSFIPPANVAGLSGPYSSPSSKPRMLASLFPLMYSMHVPALLPAFDLFPCVISSLPLSPLLIQILPSFAVLLGFFYPTLNTLREP